MSKVRIKIIDATQIEVVQSGSGDYKDGRETKDSEVGWHVNNGSSGNKKVRYAPSVHTGVMTLALFIVKA